MRPTWATGRPARPGTAHPLTGATVVSPQARAYTRRPMEAHPVLGQLDIDDLDSGASWGEWDDSTGVELTSVNPVTEQPLGSVRAPRLPAFT